MTGKGQLATIHQRAYLCNIAQSDLRRERILSKQSLEVWIISSSNPSLSSRPLRSSVLFHKT
jgi:hypothetical protein